MRSIWRWSVEPVTVTIVSALAAGAAAAAKDVATDAIKDAYAGLKRLITERYARAAPFADAVETDPASEPEQSVLAKQLEQAGAAQDEDLLRRAQAVLDAIEQQPLEQAAALGVDLERVKAANIRAKEIIAAGTGFRARDVETSGDIDLGIVRAGVDGQKNE